MPSGRPQTKQSTLLDATAVALDLPGWDAQEIGIQGNIARQLAFAFANAEHPDVVRMCMRRAAKLQQQWAEGDTVENRQHGSILTHLQVVNGLLDGSEPLKAA